MSRTHDRLLRLQLASPEFVFEAILICNHKHLRSALIVNTLFDDICIKRMFIAEIVQHLMGYKASQIRLCCRIRQELIEEAFKAM